MEPGIIVAWSGAIVDIPSGFALCDGGGGRPDLRNRFVVGAGDTYDPGDTGGVNLHDHDVVDGGHTHQLVAGSGLDGGDVTSITTTSSTMAAITGPGSNLPIYYALAFIIKL